MMEIEIAVLSRPCLSRRIGQIAELAQQVNAWAEVQNRKQVRVNWGVYSQLRTTEIQTLLS